MLGKKVDEELAGLRRNRPRKKNKELGDVLFSVINYARIFRNESDSALEKTNAKFISRFQKWRKIGFRKKPQSF